MTPETLRETLSQRAQAMNDGVGSAEETVRLLAQVRYLHQGVPRDWGGDGGTLWDAMQAIADVAERCLTSGFLFWCQRVFIEYLLHSPNTALRDRLLPDLLSGDLAGATGLSNAMKHLAGLEPLRTRAVLSEDSVTLDGFLPWASNLQQGRFVLAVAAQVDEHSAIVAAVPANAPGVSRSEDLRLLGLQASQTATVTLSQVCLEKHWLISDDAHTYLPQVRPCFLLLQCGMPVGVTRAALQNASQYLSGARAVQAGRVEELCARQQALLAQTHQLAFSGGWDTARVRQLFTVRIDWVRLAVQAVNLELESVGGAGFLGASDTARRLREVAFLPVVTPSLTQLAMQLLTQSPGESVGAP